jgi:hypothetical protein
MALAAQRGVAHSGGGATHAAWTLDDIAWDEEEARAARARAALGTTRTLTRRARR